MIFYIYYFVWNLLKVLSLTWYRLIRLLRIGNHFCRRIFKNRVFYLQKSRLYMFLQSLSITLNMWTFSLNQIHLWTGFKNLSLRFSILKHLCAFFHFWINLWNEPIQIQIIPLREVNCFYILQYMRITGLSIFLNKTINNTSGIIW